MFALGTEFAAAANPVVIAHRGASGYLPEHTLEAAAFAYALGADFIEQDVVSSKDGMLVVCHDVHIDTVTDVATRFPSRRRTDGRFYAIDFTWDELRTLRVRERFDPKTGIPVFNRRFPETAATFRLCTMEESLLLVKGLNRSTGRKVGIYPEIKMPAWHRQQGSDPGKTLIALLATHGYRSPEDPVYVQCFDPAELKRLRRETETKLRFVQLLGESRSSDSDENGIDYDRLRTESGLAEIANYAQGIGPRLADILAKPAGSTPATLTPLVAQAHAHGLVVHPYTFRADALPSGFASFAELVDTFVGQAAIDGLFTDHTDLALARLRSRK